MSLDELKNLKKARKKIGLTQANVGEKVGITANSYARIEQGRAKPSYDTLKLICKILKIPFPLNYS